MSNNIILFPLTDEAIRRLMDNELTMRIRNLSLSTYMQQYNWWEPAMEQIFRNACAVEDKSIALLNENREPHDAA